MASQPDSQPEPELILALPAKMANALLGYLSERPFREVHLLIDMLRALPETAGQQSAEPTATNDDVKD